jgi:hypothetical protein
MLALRSLLLCLAVTVMAGGDSRGAVAFVAVAGLSVLLLAWAAGVLGGRPETAVPHPSAARARARRTIFVRQRDPGAAGRSRPRAPSASPAPA